MKRIGIFLLCLCLAAGFALFSIFPFSQPDGNKLIFAQDPLDSLPEILMPYMESEILRVSPYLLAHQLPGLKGAAFVFGPQARQYQKQSAVMEYVPLSTVKAVIAVKRDKNSAGRISGWQTLLESDALVLIPISAIEGGRLMAIALARGLQAEEGDLTPAIKAYAFLQAQNRLNHQDEYKSRNYRNMVPLKNMLKYDAILLWDFQAANLSRISDSWDIITPEEGTLSVDWGILSGGKKEMPAILTVKEFLLSQQGRQALLQAGFSQYEGETDLSAWDEARLTYNPRFRREVLSAKLYSPASVQERLALQCLTLLLFGIAAQRIQKRIPRGSGRDLNLRIIALISFWMLAGIAKTLAVDPGVSRYLWFCTYIPRHLLPVCWLSICYANRSEQPLTPRILILLVSVATLLTALVFTNDIHQLVFAYRDTDPWSWTRDYTNGPVYCISVIWSFSLCLAGLYILAAKSKTRSHKLQVLYAVALIALLLVYQTFYTMGIEMIIDMDIPTTIAIFILAFNLAVQRERFMGASLLDLPILNNSPYAVAIFDKQGYPAYANATMDLLWQKEPGLSEQGHDTYDNKEIVLDKQVFKLDQYPLDSGFAIILKDITFLKQLERSLEETNQKLKSVRKLLLHDTEKVRDLTDKFEQDRYSSQMERLFKEKLGNVIGHLGQEAGPSPEEESRHLRRGRFLISICRHRLSFIIRSLETHSLFPLELIEKYAAGLINDGRRFGIDGVITVSPGSFCHFGDMEIFLEVVDNILLYAFDASGLSVICRLDAEGTELIFSCVFSWDGGDPPIKNDILPQSLTAGIRARGGKVFHKLENDGIMMRVIITGGR